MLPRLRPVEAADFGACERLPSTARIGSKGLHLMRVGKRFGVEFNELNSISRYRLRARKGVFAFTVCELYT